MVELADIFRLHGPQYRATFGDRLLPSHLRAMQDIEHCRTAALGGQLYYCAQCDEQRYSYHSCKNRHCPKCQNQQANDWLKEQQQLLLPSHHFLVTFTLPAELRPLARARQKLVYNILFRASSQALQKLAADPRFVGARVGMVGVLQTWTRDLRYHPHVHYVVTGGGLDRQGRWHSSATDFLVHGKPLGLIFRAMLRDALQKAGLFSLVDKRAWQKKWVVDLEPVGTGQAAFKYLAPYIFRVALSNNRILKLENGMVTFKYQDSATKQIKTSELTSQEFIRRFLQHVLPPRFVKVRYFGLLSPAYRQLLHRARALLAAAPGHSNTPLPDNPKTPDRVTASKAPTAALCCPNCGAVLKLIKELKRNSGLPP